MNYLTQTLITKYIKKTDMKWLLFLLIPLVVCLIIHFSIPITIVLTSNPTAQKAYNNQRLLLQQSTVRALSLLNADLIRLKLQSYQNIRNFLCKIFDEESDYLQIKWQQIQINTARQFALLVDSGADVSNITDRSMWYAQGAQSWFDLQQVQQYLLLQYTQVEPFIRTAFTEARAKQSRTNKVPHDHVLQAVSITAYYQNSIIFFQYPSAFKAEFMDLETSALDKYFNQTFLNFMQGGAGYEYTMFTGKSENGTQLLITCNMVFSNNVPAGTVCFYLNLQQIAKEVTLSLQIPNVTGYSTTDYYLLTPIYPEFADPSPKIIMNFSDKDNSNVNLPLQQHFSLPSQLPSSLYIAPPSNQTIFMIHPSDYKLHIVYQTSSLIYFQVPIYINTYRQNLQTVLYFLVEYSFKSSDFDTENKYAKILKDLTIPISIVILVSTILSLIVLRYLLNSLDQELFKINEKCEFILHGDLDLKIQDYDDTQELHSVYENIRILNFLHKFSSKEYFEEQQTKRVVRFHQVLQVFSILDYPLENVQENIGDSYMKLKQYTKALHYLHLSYSGIVTRLEDHYDYKLNEILNLKHKSNKKLSKSYKRYEMNIISKLFKLILVYRMILFEKPKIEIGERENIPKSATSIKSFQSKKQNNLESLEQIKIITTKQKTQIKQNKQYFKELRQYLSIFKRLTYPSFVTSETIYVYLLQATVEIELKNYTSAKSILKKFPRIMAQYQNQFQISTKCLSSTEIQIKKFSQMKQNMSSFCRIPPSIFWSMYYYNQSCVMLIEEENRINYPEIITMLKKSLNYSQFSEEIHYRVLVKLLEVTKIFGIDHRIVTGLTFFKQVIPLYHLQRNISAREQSESEANRLRSFSQIKTGLEKQVLFMYDCSNKWLNSLENFRKWQKETRQISSKIYQTLQPTDRISILKVNSTVLVETCCNLVYKGKNQSLVSKELVNALKLKYMSGKCMILKGLQIAIDRIKELNREKYLVVFMKSGIIAGDNNFDTASPNSRKDSNDYQIKKASSPAHQIFMKIRQNTETFSPKSRHKNSMQQSAIRHSRVINSSSHLTSNGKVLDEEQYGPEYLDQYQPRSSNFINMISDGTYIDYFKNMKQDILSLLLDEKLFNFRLILFSENMGSFVAKFNLLEINSILESQYFNRQFNNNNYVYFCQSTGASENIDAFQDIERIFGKKKQKIDIKSYSAFF